MSPKTNIRYNAKKSAKSASPKLLWLLIGLLLIAAIIGAIYWKQNSDNSAKQPATTNGINLSPATEEEKQDSNAIKEQTYQEEQKAQSDAGQTGSQKAVTPVIVDAGQYDGAVEVRAYISGVVENGGSCSFVLTKDSAKVTKTVQGFADATTTKCPNTSIPRSEFPSPGKWSLVVSYNSASARGELSPVSIEVK